MISSTVRNHDSFIKRDYDLTGDGDVQLFVVAPWTFVEQDNAWCTRQVLWPQDYPRSVDRRLTPKGAVHIAQPRDQWFRA